MGDRAPVAIAISEESGRRVELHDDRVARAFRAFDGYDVKEIVTDGGHRHATDRVDGTVIAECPNSTDADDDHLQIEVGYEAASDELVKDLRETWPDCGECGATLTWLVSSEPTEVMTDGGENTFLDDNQEWLIIGLVENALSRREERRWEACRRLVQQALAQLDRETRAHRLLRDGCCSSHPSSSQWADALQRAKSALEVHDR